MTSEPWSISVKTVGGGFSKNDEEDSCGERNFTVTVSPEDYVASLHKQIEGATGLKASQQRLIYRGRLIGRNENPTEDEFLKIKDIAGLSDGQTIHLLKKRETEAQGASADANVSGEVASAQTSASSLDSDALGGSGSGSASLLAALLGLSSFDDDNNNSNNERDSARQRWGWRSSRLGRRRRPHYRLTAEDLEVPDPGTMEPVRQGLMTLHTLFPHARVARGESQSPLEASRQWYRGQWIDCRDTVNQWLEATVVEIVKPDDILPPMRRLRDSEDEARRRRRRRVHVFNDPAVGASDFEGRRRLLLEACPEGDSDEEDPPLSGFRRRDTNDNIQLLLIHYNGWPHRWDEWIRSDSERIRPFRTRTRHPTSVRRNWSACLGVYRVPNFAVCSFRMLAFRPLHNLFSPKLPAQVFEVEMKRMTGPHCFQNYVEHFWS